MVLIRPMSRLQYELTFYIFENNQLSQKTTERQRIEDSAIAALQSGQYRLAPPRRNAIWIGDLELSPYN